MYSMLCNSLEIKAKESKAKPFLETSRFIRLNSPKQLRWPFLRIVESSIVGHPSTGCLGQCWGWPSLRTLLECVNDLRKHQQVQIIRHVSARGVKISYYWAMSITFLSMPLLFFAGQPFCHDVNQRPIIFHSLTMAQWTLEAKGIFFWHGSVQGTFCFIACQISVDIFSL